MRNVIALAQREILDRRRFVMAGLLLGGMTLVLPLLPFGGATRTSYSGTRDVTAAMIAAGLAQVVAISMGLSVIARDVVERRMSFYFARPLSGLEIWGGKMLGALLLSLACGVAVLVPATLMGGGLFALPKINAEYFPTSSSGATVAGAISLAAIALVLTHPLSIALRSRSRWLILDVVAWSASGLAVMLLSAKLASRGVTQFDSLLMGFYSLTFLIAAVLGGALQVVLGRTDLVRGHRAMSIALWSIVAGSVLAAGSYVFWVDSARPRDFDLVNARSISADGEWAVVEGSRRFGRGHPIMYLVNTRDGRHVRANSRRWGSIPTVSIDSSHAAWIEPRSFFGMNERYVAVRTSLRDERLRPVETDITMQEEPQSTISPDGARLATIGTSSTLVVSDLVTGKTVAAIRIPASGELKPWRVRLIFLDRDRIRIYIQTVAEADVSRAGSVSIGEVDVRARSYRHIANVSHVGYFSLNRANDRMLVFQSTSATKRIDLVDAGTGEAIAAISRTRGTASFIPGRRVAVCERDGGMLVLKVFDDEGHLLRSIPVRIGMRGFVACAIRADHLLVETISSEDPDQAKHALDVVDVNTGAVRPLGTTWNRSLWPRRSEVAVARPLFNAPDDRVMQLDPATGTWKDLLR